MASPIQTENIEDNFTGFEEEPVVNTEEKKDKEMESKPEDTANESDSDSGNLVIAEHQQKQDSKIRDRSPRKRKSRVFEDPTPTRTLPSRVKGRGLAYLLAMEKGGGKRRLAQAQAQVEAQETAVANSKAEDVSEKVEGVESDILKIQTKELENATQRVDPPAPVVRPRLSFSRKSYGAANISSPLLKEPFKHGWRREVVYRATVDPGTKTLCDVYYYTPDGKKLRSGREVADYLDKSDSSLLVENFTFFKEPIGMDPAQETLRYAKQRRDDGGGDRHLTKKEKALKAREEELRRNLQDLGQDVAAITGQTPTEGDGVQQPGSQPTSPLKKKKGKGEKQLKIKLWGKALRSKENAEPLATIAAGKEDIPPCSSECAKAQGQLPTQTCQQCFCLFHPVCVPVESPTKCVRCTNTPEKTPGRKTSPVRSLPGDISHLFSPHTPGSGTRSSRSSTRNQKGMAKQNLEMLNGKRFISVSSVETGRSSISTPSGVGGGSEVNDSPTPSHGIKRPLSSPDSRSSVEKPITKKVKGMSHISGSAVGSYAADQLMNFVSHAYHGLLHVFRYLTVQELMAAAGVCRLWRDLALHHSHWRLVRLKNSRIYDWPAFTGHLKRAGTQHLDMRKMLFVTSREETWANLAKAASNLSEILRIDLCKCPGEVLETVALHCPRLEYIDAQSISSSTIRLSALGNVTHLKEIKIRGVSGLCLEDGLQSFGSLKQLKSVSLTAISNMKSSELAFLADLPYLENLDIGDCSGWCEESDYNALCCLSHLKHLRLEQGPNQSVANYFKFIANIPHLNHLELINFSLTTPLDNDHFSGLKHLLIIPRYNEETLTDTVRNVYNASSKMNHLQQLNWVVTEEILTSIPDNKLPSVSEESNRLTCEELQESLRKCLTQAHVKVICLPEYSTHRYSLSLNQEE